MKQENVLVYPATKIYIYHIMLKDVDDAKIYNFKL